jgi:hypothetical protein
MIMTTQRLTLTIAAATAAACLLQPASAAAEQSLQITSSAAERRMVITTAGAATGSEAVWSGALQEGGVVTRFVVEPVDEHAVMAGWAIELSGTLGGVAVRFGRFDAELRELVLPKPLGFRFEAGDSITLRLAAGSASASWRIVAEYELLDAPVSRLAVLPFQLERVGDDKSAWELTAPVSGRLLALAGLTAAGSTELSLEDSESGAMVWREVVSTGTAESFGCAQGIVRVGVMIRQDRTYRMVASGPDAAGAMVNVFVLPVGARQLAAK